MRSHKKHKLSVHRKIDEKRSAESAAVEIDEATLWGRPKYTEAEQKAHDATALARQKEIKEAFKHCWDGYREKAWGRDELHPASGRSNDKWGGIGMTTVSYTHLTLPTTPYV